MQRMLKIEGQLRTKSLGMGDPNSLYELLINVVLDPRIDLLRKGKTRRIQRIIEVARRFQRNKLVVVVMG